jgi:hypothetical protein
MTQIGNLVICADKMKLDSIGDYYKNNQKCLSCGETIIFKQDSVFINDGIFRCQCGKIYTWRGGFVVPILEI